METLLNLVGSYWGVFFLMGIESSFIPFPSELVIPPAAYLAYQGDMNVFLVVLVGILGSLLGALVNYFLAMWLGRPLVYVLVEKRWARMFLLSKSKVEKAEKYFLERGGVSTFVGRLLPAIRQLISLPAGFSRMHLGKFIGFTALGTGVWVSVLAVLGYYFGAQQELIAEYSHLIGSVLLLVVLLAVFGFLFFKKRRGKA